MRLAEDRYRRTVRIPVTVEKGHVLRSGGGDLPEIRDGAVAELVLDFDALLDVRERERLAGEEVVPFFPPGTELWVRVSPQSIPAHLARHATSRPEFPGSFVRVILKKALMIRLRGAKPGTLMNVECVIPALKAVAGSVNHAYRLISEAFEPHRISHAGNVFQEVFRMTAKGPRPLDAYRDLASSERTAAEHPKALLFE